MIVINNRKSQIGNRLRLFIENLGISKAEFGRRIGVVPQNVNRYLTAEADIFSIIGILEEMGCNIDWLLTGKEPDKSPGEVNYKVLAMAPAGRGELTIYEDFTYYQYDDLNFDSDTHGFIIVDNNNGNSMYPLLQEGDRLLISLTKPALPGDIVFAHWGDQASGAIKIYNVFSHKDTHSEFVTLASYNQAHNIIMLPARGVKVYPVVLIKKLRK